MDPSTDRLGGDPYSAYIHYDWIGSLKTAPLKVCEPKELDHWSVLNTRYVCEYTDVGVCGIHKGSYITNLEEDGSVTIRDGEGKFEDVDPETLTSERKLKLELTE